jgi:hypothetical protein
MSFGSQHDVGARLIPQLAADNTSLTAAGAGDNTQVVGVIIDRTLLNYPLSAILALAWKAVLGASATLTLKTVLIEHGDASNLSDAASLATFADVVVATDSGSGSTLRGCQEYKADLAGAKRYVRFKFTPDLSAANTDTATVAAVAVFGGSDTEPV